MTAEEAMAHACNAFAIAQENLANYEAFSAACEIHKAYAELFELLNSGGRVQ